MSSDRTCMMSDLRSAKSELRSEIAIAESIARRAESSAQSMRLNIEDTHRRVQELASDMGHLSGEVSQQQQRMYEFGDEIAHLLAQQQADRRVVQRNGQLIAGLQQHVSDLEQDVSVNRQEIAQVRQYAHTLQQTLQAEIDLAQQRIAANEQHIQQLNVGVQQINQYLAAERQRQEAERQAKRDDIATQSRLAAQLKAQLEPARVRFFGAYNEYLSALTLLDQAQQNQVKGHLEAAIAQYQQGQSLLLKVARDVDERERTFQDRRAQCQAAIDQLGAELELLNTEDMQAFYPAEYAQLRRRVDALRESFQRKQYENAGEPVEVRQALDQLTTQAMQAYQDVRLLETRLFETLAQHQERNARVRDILRALRRVWDQDFPYELNFLNESDPKSTLKLQTVRPGAPNVTVYLDLDRTMQFSWTGYEGLKCLDDVKQFEQVMRQEHQVVVELGGAPRDYPQGKPNPPFGGGGVTVPLPVVHPPVTSEVQQPG